MKKILVVVDMQNDFITGALGTPEAAGALDRVVKRVRQYDGMVVFTRDTHENNYLETREGKSLPVPHCLRGSEGWMLAAPLEEIRKEKMLPVFDKNTFGSKDLIDFLVIINGSEGIAELEFIGVCTDICVISNAMSIRTFLPEVEITVNSSCCAGVSPDSHNAALDAMKACQIRVI